MNKNALFAAVRNYSQSQAEPDWLLTLREQAVATYADLTWPKFEKIDYSTWPLADFSAPKNNVSTEPSGNLGAGQHFYAVGDTTMQLSLPTEAIQQGVILSDLRAAIRTHGDLVRQALMTKGMQPDTDKFTALNTALMTNGFFLYIPENVQLKQPIEITQFVDGRQAQNFFNRSLVLAAENSRVQVIQRLGTIGTQATTAHVRVEVIADANAQVEFAGLDTLGANTTATLNRYGILAPDAQLNWELAEMNAGNVVADFESALVGRGAVAQVKTIAIANGKQTQGIETRVTNYGKKTTANIVQRGIILDAATLIFNGIGHIVKGAHGAKADQENHLLMLSSNARGDANPILLIDENDVEAGHAASVGRVDERQMYYLLSRGIPRPEAERLVIRGFLAGVITELRSKRLRTELNSLIERRLTDGKH